MEKGTRDIQLTLLPRQRVTELPHRIPSFLCLRRTYDCNRVWDDVS
jgi:hypothetical protein